MIVLVDLDIITSSVDLALERYNYDHMGNFKWLLEVQLDHASS